MLVSRNLLKKYIGETMPTTDELVELLTMHAFEVEGTHTVGDDEVIDVDILPNRSSDSLCHRGVAREIATLTDTPLINDPLTGDVTFPKTDKVALDIADTNACRRFGVALITGATIQESPEWLQNQLRAIGQRPINAVVDATNYVMFSLGQPLHAYDADKLSQKEGPWRLGTRFAKEKEELTVLTGETFTLDSSMQIIVDGNTNEGVGIAGIKGGAHAEIDAGTTRIILEAANFDPKITRKASQKLKLQTDASKRFENEPSPELIPHALREAVTQIVEMCGGECEGYVDVYPEPKQNNAVPVTLQEINALLGLSLTTDEVFTLSQRLGFSANREGEAFTITAPFERTDITIAADVIEEIGRVYGYSHIQGVLPETVPLVEVNKRHYYSEKIRQLLVGEKYSEVITSSFRKKDDIELHNYLASDKACLRSSLRENIQETLEKNVLNIELLNIDAVRVFEIGTVFLKAQEGKGIHEHVSLAIGVRTKKQGFTPKDDEELRKVAQKLEGALGVPLRAEAEKGVLEINVTDLLPSLKDPVVYEPIEKQAEVAYRPYSTYPYISRDVALWVPEDVVAEDITRLIHTHAGELLAQTALFDEFHKDGRVSYAFRLIFQSMERTLTDEEVNSAMESVQKALQDAGYEIR